MDERAAKARLRAEMKALRAGLPAADLHVHAAAAAAQVLALREWREARTVCLYASFKQELGTTPLLQAALRDGKRLVLPRARPDGTLDLHAIGDLSSLTSSSLGIPEPAAGSPKVAPESVDFFLVPGLAFDDEGRRLGYGAGFYDRLLAQARPTAFSLGYGYEFQVTPEVPTEPHDRLLQAVATPDRVLRGRSS
jgi:5-formyltetrahydrofolate cyclo-ligase